MKRLLAALFCTLGLATPLRAVNWDAMPVAVNSGTSYFVSATAQPYNDSNGPGSSQIVTILKNGANLTGMGGSPYSPVTASTNVTDTGEQQVTYTAIATVQLIGGGTAPNGSAGPSFVNIDANPPTTPPAPSAGVAATSLALSWTPSTDAMSSVAAYEIDRTGASVVTSGSANHTITGLLPNTGYQIRVRARDIFNHWSAWGPYLNVTTGLDPLLDGDGDGIANGWEARYPTATSPTADTDGDGWSNLDEYRRGTDPTAADPTPAASTLVAALTGEFSVDNKGSASYTIPLKIAPGRGGLQPSLALAYSSGGGNGTMGFGWSLSTGFPQSITRGRTILARDGLVRGVDFDDTNSDLRYRDKFYLDGKRLICVSGNAGQPNSTYRTEVDSFVTITATGTGTNIDTFVVTDKSGVQMTFGKYLSSVDGYQMGAMSGETKAHAYALKHVQDTVGNAVDFNYTEILGAGSVRQGEYVLSEILYTANPSQSLAAQARVQLDYNASPRADAASSFTAGRQFAQTRRLDAIRAQFNTGSGYIDVSRYDLEYAYTATGSRLRLMAVASSFRNPTTSAFDAAPKITFAWSDPTLTTSAKLVPGLPTNDSTVPTLGHNPYAWGDFNGDGKEDYAAASLSEINVYLANGSGFTLAGNWASGMGVPATTLFAADINGDGCKDLFFASGNFANNAAIVTHIYAVLSNGSRFTGMGGSTTTPTLVTDTNTILRDPMQTTYLVRDGEEGSACGRILAQDFTGDGRDDLLIHGYDGSLHLFRSQGTVFAAVQTSSNIGSAFVVQPFVDWRALLSTHFSAFRNQIMQRFSVTPMPGDFNGDGLTDYAWAELAQSSPGAVIYSNNKQLFVSLARPDGSFGPSQLVTAQTIGAGTNNVRQQDVMMYALPGDFNGDGTSDFLVLRGAQVSTAGQRWTLVLSKGTAPGGGLAMQQTAGIIPETFSYGGETLPTFYKPVEDATWTAWNMDDPPGPSTYQDPNIFAVFTRVFTSVGEHTQAMDVNQDGRTDLVWFVWKNVGETSAANRGWYVMYSTGSGFTSPARLTGQPWDELTGHIEPLAPNNHQSCPRGVSFSQGSDIDGDGRPDSTYQMNTSYRTFGLQGWFRGQGAFPNLITGVNAGPAGRTEVLYAAAKSDAVYTPGAAVSYPIRELRASSPVVADVYKDSGDYFGFFGDPLHDLSGIRQRNVAHFSYQYSGNRLDLSGRGPLGFHSFVTLDRQTNLFKYQFLAQSFPMTGLTHREQTYRYWAAGSSVYFRTISSHDNTVVFDEVSNGSGGTWATVYPFMSKAVESRWEDSTGAHYTWDKNNPNPALRPTPVAAAVHSSSELLFTSYTASPPANPHITITAKSWFDNHALGSEPPTTLPGPYFASDTNGSGQNIVVGIDSFPVFDALTFPRQITYGNLRQLTTVFGGGFSESVVTTYAPPVDVVVNGITVRTLFGRPASVSTTVTSPAPYNTENAPTKSFTYATVSGAQTALVDVETVTASDPKLSFSTDYNYDSLGRRTTTTISGYNNPGPEGATVIGSLTDANVQHVGSFVASSITGYEAKYDAPTTTKNAQPYEHTTTTAYHSFLGQPVSVSDANGASVTTDYDALGRATKVTDVLKQLATRSSFAWTTASASNWTKTQTVAPPGGHTGVASGAPITGVVGVTVSSVYATRAYETRATDDLSYKPEVWTYFDRLGRAIRTIKVGFNEQKTVTDTAYNSLGQAIAVTLPYPDGGTVLWAKTAYDALGRVVTVTAPNGTVTTNEYYGRATKVTVDAANFGGANPAPQTNVTLVDFKGRTVKVWNADNIPGTITVDGTGMSAPSIEYRLDGFGRMRETWLEGSNGTVATKKITATYDAHGRQLSLNDPDKGNWAYVNNALGHVVKQTDARASVTRSTFDRLGRQRSRETKETDTSPVETADWFYYDLATTVSANPSLHLVDRVNKGWIGAPQREKLLNGQVVGGQLLNAPPGYQPSTRSAAVSNPHDTETVHYYNDRGLPAIDVSSIDGKWFYTATEYDSTYWRVSQVRHYWRPSLLEAGNSQPYVWHDYGYSYGYGSRSYLTTMTDSAGRIWWDQPSYDFLDRVVSARKGQGLFTQRTYRAEDGVVTAFKTGATVGATSVQNLGFGFDGLGNLINRTGPPGTETFAYDILNRLTTRNGATIVTYDSVTKNGNILTKVDVAGTTSGTYAYSATKPHAVTSAWGFTMGYDANGNLNSRSGGGSTWAFRYAGFDKPRWMARDTSGTDFTNGTFGSEFLYNASRSRVLHLEFDQMASGVPSHYTRKKVYAYGATMEVDYDNTAAAGTAAWSMKTVRIYVPGPDGSIGTMEFNPNATFDRAEKKLVYHYDHLGSIESITNWADTSGALAADDAGKPSRFSYDPWGERRNPTTWSGKPQTTGGNASDDGGPDGVTPRGFTSHEMLDDLGLVHMNGRIYDPLVGRMLSADLVVQFPTNLQSFNRYTYVRNNPLTLIDPSGFEDRPPQNLLEAVQQYIQCHNALEEQREALPWVLRKLDDILGTTDAMQRANDTMLVNALTGEGYGVITTEQQVEIMAPVVANQIALSATLMSAAALVAEQLAKETDGSDQQNEERLPEPETGSDGGRVNQGAKDAPAEQTQEEAGEWIYGPEKDTKVNEDGSTNERTWTTPDDFKSQEEAQDKLDSFKPAEGRRRVTIPEGSTVKRGITPGHDPNGPYDGEGGARETLHEEGLPPGSVGPWEPIPRKEDL